MSVDLDEFEALAALAKESERLAAALEVWFAACPKRMTDRERADTIRLLKDSMSLSQRLQVHLVDAVHQRLEVEAELVYLRSLALMTADATMH